MSLSNRGRVCEGGYVRLKGGEVVHVGKSRIGIIVVSYSGECYIDVSSSCFRPERINCLSGLDTCRNEPVPSIYLFLLYLRDKFIYMTDSPHYPNTSPAPPFLNLHDVDIIHKNPN